MDDAKVEWGRLVARIDRMETQNRRLRVLGVLLLVVTFSPILWSEDDPVETIELQRLVLRDPAGRIQGVLQSGERGAELVFYDWDQKERLRLAMRNRKPGPERPRDPLGHTKRNGMDMDRGAAVILSDPTGKAAVEISGDDRDGRVSVASQDGYTSLGGMDGKPGLRITGGAEIRVFTSGGEPYVEFRRPNGAHSMRLTSHDLRFVGLSQPWWILGSSGLQLGEGPDRRFSLDAPYGEANMTFFGDNSRVLLTFGHDPLSGELKLIRYDEKGRRQDLLP